METQLLLPTDEALSKAAAILKAGGLVAFPTETVYGLGANALDASAVTQIFEAKQRPQDNPLIVHIADAKDAQALCHVSETAQMLMQAFFPGALTLLMPKKPIIPSVTTAGLLSVGIRMPAHPVAQNMIRLAGVPIAAPSANRSGKPSPTTAQHVLDDMRGRIPMILDGGASKIGLESTVLDLTGNVPTILRPGGVTKEMLTKVLSHVAVTDSIMRPLRPDEKALSPGMRYKHYAPQGTLALVEGEPNDVLKALCICYDAAEKDGHTACVFAFDEDFAFLGDRRKASLGSRSNPNEMANRLFALLRMMDDQQIDYIYSVVIDTGDIGLAVMNRLGRAAGFHFISAEDVIK